MKAVCTKKHESGQRYRFIDKKHLFFWTKKRKAYFKGPKYKEQVTIKIEYWSDGIKWYQIVEWPGKGYHSDYFKTIEENTEQKSEYSEMKEVTFTEIKKNIPVHSEN